MAEDQVEFIHAAGGLIWRESPGGQELLVIHRRRYDDWSLPKGKLDPGEKWQEAALREVREETNYEATIISFAGVVTYMHGKRPKIVLYWNMAPLYKAEPAESEPEVDDVQWLDVDKARERLSYPGEIALIDQNRMSNKY